MGAVTHLVKLYCGRDSSGNIFGRAVTHLQITLNTIQIRIMYYLTLGSSGPDVDRGGFVPEVVRHLFYRSACRSVVPAEGPGGTMGGTLAGGGAGGTVQRRRRLVHWWSIRLIY